MAKKILCQHIAVLPEAASVVFGGGFWRLPSVTARKSAQRAIFQVQKEMEFLVLNEKSWTMALCDRGTLDGYAYWPDSENQFWAETQTSRDDEYSRYKAVIHLRTPTQEFGYNHQNPLRTETAQQALAIDQKIAHVWSSHPNYLVIESTEDFLFKAQSALKMISQYLPGCCREKIGNSIA